MNHTIKWEVGDRYYIHLWSSGEPIYGDIVKIENGNHTIEWGDGKITIEKEPQPAASFWMNSISKKIRARNES